MRLVRMQVEEGFLDGLDLWFEPGLNVLIGPRGTGKTSVLELIRFGFGVGGFSDESEREARSHALAVLGSGVVRLTIIENGEEVRLTRSASDSTPRRSGETSFLEPIVLSQSEIEQVGLQPSGRLRLVDGFRAGTVRSAVDEAAALSRVSSLTVEIAATAGEIRGLDEQLILLPSLELELADAISQQQASGASVEGLAGERERLSLIGALLARESGSAEVLDRAGAQIHRLGHLLADASALPAFPSNEVWPADEVAAEVRRGYLAAVGHLASAELALAAAQQSLDRLSMSTRAVVSALEDEARGLRQQIDAVSEGAGAEARRVADLQAQLGRLGSLAELRAERVARLTSRQEQRAEGLSALDAIREQRVRGRQRVIDELNVEFGPTLQFELQAFGEHGEYISALVEALRGSGLHYNSLAPKIAEALSPQELVELVETADSQRLARLAGLPLDRATKVVSSLSENGLQEVLSAPIEDNVQLSLLDGSSYKPSTRLSTGQRCTIVLPLVLRHRDRALIVDQPEDHLDNAFIVDTVVKAIRQRSRGEQMICATHNPNIPVLGEASKVFVLGSDGRRGFERSSGSLDDPTIVSAITSVMEGGLEAFERRATFYRGHGLGE